MRVHLVQTTAAMVVGSSEVATAEEARGRLHRGSKSKYIVRGTWPQVGSRGAGAREPREKLCWILHGRSGRRTVRSGSCECFEAGGVRYRGTSGKVCTHGPHKPDECTPIPSGSLHVIRLTSLIDHVVIPSWAFSIPVSRSSKTSLCAST